MLSGDKLQAVSLKWSLGCEHKPLSPTVLTQDFFFCGQYVTNLFSFSFNFESKFLLKISE